MRDNEGKGELEQKVKGEKYKEALRRMKKNSKPVILRVGLNLYEQPLSRGCISAGIGALSTVSLDVCCQNFPSISLREMLLLRYTETSRQPEIALG